MLTIPFAFSMPPAEETGGDCSYSGGGTGESGVYVAPVKPMIVLNIASKYTPPSAPVTLNL